MVYDENQPLPQLWQAVDQLNQLKRWTPDGNAQHEDLLAPIYRGGKRVLEMPSLPEIQSRAFNQLQFFQRGVKRFVNPHLYPVGIEENLHRLKAELIEQARQKLVPFAK